MNKKQEVHILLGCADARDLNQLQIESIDLTKEIFLERGIVVDFFVIRKAGSFVTPTVINDIKRIIEQNQRECSISYDDISYYVHIQAHGHLTDTSNKSYISHIYDLDIVPNSNLNCGMLNATTVAIELEQMIIEEKLTIKIKGQDFVIDEDFKIRTLMRQVYAHDGYLAGDWIKSINNLRTHPREQKANLEKAIAKDADLKKLHIKITAGIQDYTQHCLIRVDDGYPAVPFWDEHQMNIRRRLESGDYDHTVLRQCDQQEPLAGLLCMSDPRMSSRLLAAEYYCRIKNIETNNQYLPNAIFNIAGGSMDVPMSPFGPYSIAGFYYAVKALGLKDQMIMGYDDAQTQRIILKIKNDPIMNLVVNKYNVNLIPLNQVDFE
jgi:hypothetical protein